MGSLTFEQYKHAIGAFNSTLMEHLLVVDENQFRFSAAYVKWVASNPYVFASIKVAEVRIDFTISYDHKYRVPVFHFRFYEGDRLTFDAGEILRFKDALRIENMNNLQLETHDLLNTTWFIIHPCKTQSQMDSLMAIEAEGSKLYQKYALKYLISWFNTYGLSGVFSKFSLRVPNEVLV